jgi:hypothetical protein
MGIDFVSNHFGIYVNSITTPLVLRNNPFLNNDIAVYNSVADNKKVDAINNFYIATPHRQ